MARFQVLFGAGSRDVLRCRVRARTHHDAYQRALSETGRPYDVRWISVRRVRRLLLRDRDGVTFLGGYWPGSGGAAGVREPRRPSPTPPSLRRALDDRAS